jgi:hypothetical protein
MTNNKIQKFLVLVTLSAGVFAVGCELIVDFDRTKIPVEVTEASVVDSAPPSEASTPEAGPDAGPDAEADATTEASVADADADADQ